MTHRPSPSGGAVGTAVAALSWLVVALVASGSATATFPGDNGLIAFASNRHPLLANPTFFAVDVSGGVPEELTGAARDAAWGVPSPDGRLVAFTRGGYWQHPLEIWLMNADGSDQRLLVRGWDPVWSPDGKTIAYEAGYGECGGYRCGHTIALWSVQVDGSGVRLLSAASRNPSWSPNSRRLVFEAALDPYGTAHGIRVASSNGTNARWLAREARVPVWSPNGRLIAYSSVHGLHVVRPDGTGRRRLTAHSWMPIWAAGGTRLAYVCAKDRALCTVDVRGRRRRVLARGVLEEEVGVHSKAAAPVAAWSRSGARLAYARRDGIFVVNVDGRGRRRVTANETGARLGRLKWSPDERRLLFTQVLDATDLEIYTVAADGSGVQPLTDNAVEDVGPSWSPDGTRLAFSRRRARGHVYDVWVMTASGDGERIVARDAGISSWTRDGSRLLIRRGGSTYSVSPEGGDERRSGPAFYMSSSSPDGSKLAFVGERASDYGEVFVAAADGSNARRLTSGAEVYGRLSWSPDGTTLAFYSYGYRQKGVYTVRVDGTGLTRVAAGAGDPSFSPDGTALAFSSGSDGTGRIEVSGLDGSARRVVTAARGSTVEPDWQPVPR